MNLPKDGDTLTTLKNYVRYHKLNKPEIKLSMNKPELVKGLKKHGHWSSKDKVSKKDFDKARLALKSKIYKKK